MHVTQEPPSSIRLQLMAAIGEPPARAWLDDPLDVLFAEHFRIRAMLNLLDQLARRRLSPQVREIIARSLASFLRRDLEEHLRDEEEGLFPLLGRRLALSDLLDPSLRRIVAGHGDCRDLGVELARLIEPAEAFAARPAEPGFRRLASSFSRSTRRCVTVENCVVIPLARARLTARDLRALDDWMIQRRCPRAACRPPPHRPAGECGRAPANVPAAEEIRR